MASMVLVPYGTNPNFDIVSRVMVTSLRLKKKETNSNFKKNCLWLTILIYKILCFVSFIAIRTNRIVHRNRFKRVIVLPMNPAKAIPKLSAILATAIENSLTFFGISIDI
ncbi:hypothetical protein BpHYR1_051623 [Brachionus plicatilis]|uniref:Uncharacterized protein n=1 Tax=Brachionus plicatilis TaxID=10195 RepID=A0A3M7R0D0_BRAPC|nr:hypothetical protein BpHYR1_051623 [Brachionus plicatilis]